MKILMVAQTGLPVPSPEDKIFAPGIIFSSIAQGLKNKGHEITVFASADSKLKDLPVEGFNINSNHFERKNFSTEELEIRLNQHQLYLISAAFEEYKKGEYDLLYLDSFPLSEYFSSFVNGPIVCIHHGVPADDSDLRLDIDKLRQKKYFKRINFIAISENQRKIGREYFNYVAMIHHGIDLNDFHFNGNPGNDLLSIGRINPKKGTDIAIEVALQAKNKINIWGDHKNDQFWNQKVKPQLDNQNAIYRGHCDFKKVGEIYGQAKALLLPISWEEPFGLVAVEAMACGTPVIAFKKGSMSELIVDGVTGFLLKPGDIDGMVQAVKKIDQIDRKKCREHVENNFSLNKMIDKYEEVFTEIINKNCQ